MVEEIGRTRWWIQGGSKGRVSEGGVRVKVELVGKVELGGEGGVSEGGVRW